MTKSPNTADSNRKEIAAKRKALKDMIARYASGREIYETPVPNMSVFCVGKPNTPSCLIYEPCLCIAAQGAKLVSVANESFLYDSRHYLVASITLPVSVQIVRSSKDKPYYGFKLKLDPKEIAQIMFESGMQTEKSAQPSMGVVLGKINAQILDAACRLVSLLDTPSDIPILSPIIQKEIIYRILSGPQGFLLKQLAVSGSPTSRMARSIGWLKNNFSHKIKIGALANIANMSVSAFHKHFREMTAMSPLQYQKILRLQKARSLMTSEDMDAATAAYHVGYESPTQFNREYKRMFGESPRRDVRKHFAAI